MALEHITDLGAIIDADLPDNATGAITPAVLRSVLHDMVDSLWGRACSLFGEHISVPIVAACTATPTNFPALQDEVVNNNPTMFTVNIAASTITVLSPGAGYAFTFILGFTCAGTAGVDVQGLLYKNSVRVDRFSAATECTGAGKMVGGAFSALVTGVVANDVFEVRFATPGGANNITFYNVELNLVQHPTLSAV